MKYPFILLFVLSLLIIFACSDEDCPTCPEDETDNYQVNVSGTVYGYVCNAYQPYNGSFLYAINSGEKAVVKFLRLNEESYIYETNDSSVYAFELDTGLYDIILETRHSFPDTSFNVNITEDTIIDLEIFYLWMESNTIYIQYFYSPAADSLGDSIERYYIDYLSDWLGDAITIDTAGINRYNSPIGYYSVTYPCIVDRQYYAWDIMIKANWRKMSNYADYPEEMLIYMGYFPCLH